MKRVTFKYSMLVVLGALPLAQNAIAESSVTLYGRLNPSYEWQSTKYDRTVNNVTAGAATQDTSLSYAQKFSGFTQRSNEARFGFDGTEELSGGWKVRFAVEHSFRSDVGGGDTEVAAGSLGDRKAWVGVSHDDVGSLRFGFGGGSSDLSPFFQQFDDNTIKLNDDTGATKILYNMDKRFLDIATPAGSHYDPSSAAVRWASASGAGILSASNFADQAFTSTFGRTSDRNNVAYFSPRWAGFSFGVRFATIGANDSIRANGKDLGAGRETDTKLYDLAFNYNKDGLFAKDDAFYVGVGYQANGGHGSDYATGLTASELTNKFDRIQLSASYKFANNAKISFLAGTGKDKWRSYDVSTNPVDGVATTTDNFSVRNKMTYVQIGGLLPFAERFDIGGNYARFTGKLTGTDYAGTATTADDSSLNSKVTHQQLQAMLGYNVSIRTRAYTFIDFVRSKETGSYRDTTTGNNGVDFTGRTKRTTFGVGLMHNF